MISPAANTSRTAEWWTPPEVLEIATETLGRIDLDPCAPRAWPGHVPAATRFTTDDDGLARDWFGRVYMNPPYGRAVGTWVRKAITEVATGRAEVVLALVAARTDTRWFRPLLRYPVAFVHGRIRFFSPYGHANNEPAFPSALVLIRRSWTADDLDAFARAVGPRGTVVVPWEAI